MSTEEEALSLPANMSEGVESFEATMECLLHEEGGPPLFKSLTRDPCANTVFEYTVKDWQRMEIVKCMGIQYSVPDDHDVRVYNEEAIRKVLRLVDWGLFFGAPDQDARETPGLGYTAKWLEAAFGTRHIYDANNLADRVAFYKRFDDDRERQSLKMYHPSQAQYVGEGDLPRTRGAFVVGAGAIKWRQLLPMTRMPLVTTMREGRFTETLTGDPVPPFTEGSTTFRRFAVMLYGTVEVVDPDALFVLEG